MEGMRVLLSPPVEQRAMYWYCLKQAVCGVGRRRGRTLESFWEKRQYVTRAALVKDMRDKKLPSIAALMHPFVYYGLRYEESYSGRSSREGQRSQFIHVIKVRKCFVRR